MQIFRKIQRIPGDLLNTPIFAILAHCAPPGAISGVVISCSEILRYISNSCKNFSQIGRNLSAPDLRVEFVKKSTGAKLSQEQQQEQQQEIQKKY